MSRGIEQVMRNMAEIDFGTLVTAVVDELSMSASELFGDEMHDSDLAVQRYKRNVVGAIRRVFDEAEAPAPVVPTCRNCGAPVGEGYRFCTRCGAPQTSEAAAEILERLLVKDLGMNPEDPKVLAAIACIREEQPEQWDALVQKISAMAKE